MNSELEFGKLDAIISNEIGYSSLMALMNLYGRNLAMKENHVIYYSP